MLSEPGHATLRVVLEVHIHLVYRCAPLQPREAHMSLQKLLSEMTKSDERWSSSAPLMKSFTPRDKDQNGWH